MHAGGMQLSSEYTVPPGTENIWTFKPPVKTGGYLKLYSFGINFLNSTTLGNRGSLHVQSGIYWFGSFVRYLSTLHQKI